MNEFDTILAEQQHHIRVVGWAVTAVLPTTGQAGAPFAYTVGLTAHQHPELLIAGVDPYTAHELLNAMASRVVHNGARLVDGQRIDDLIVDYDAVMRSGQPTRELVAGTACARYGHDRVRLTQIVWPCPHSRFPWEDGYCLPAGLQPLLAKP